MANGRRRNSGTGRKGNLVRPIKCGSVERFPYSAKLHSCMRGHLTPNAEWQSEPHRLARLRYIATLIMQAQRPRFAFDIGLVSASHAPLQKRIACLVKLVCCRFAAAVPVLRALPARALAPLSHILRSGFFFVHGFATASSS